MSQRPSRRDYFKGGAKGKLEFNGRMEKGVEKRMVSDRQKSLCEDPKAGWNELPSKH